MYDRLLVRADLVLVGSSARSVGVYDLNAGLVASELRDAHSTAPHCLRFNQVHVTYSNFVRVQFAQRVLRRAVNI